MYTGLRTPAFNRDPAFIRTIDEPPAFITTCFKFLLILVIVLILNAYIHTCLAKETKNCLYQKYVFGY